MESITRTIEGHQIAVRLVRLRADGTPASGVPAPAPPFFPASPASSPSLPAEAPFGTVHLGEKFGSRLVVANEGLVDLQRVRVKVELQTSTQRAVLLDIEPDVAAAEADAACGVALPAGEALPIDVLHDIREVGVHVMVCSVHYTNPVTNERKFARKFFKFTVVNPLALKTKITEMPALDALLLEAQLQNVSSSTFFLESVRFDPAPPLSASTLAPAPAPADLVRLVGGLHIGAHEPATAHPAEYRFAEHEHAHAHAHAHAHRPDCMYQFVFVLSSPAVIPAAAPLTLGKLDIRWRSETGETGRLQTAPLVHPDSALDAITVHIKSLPSPLFLHEPFEALFVFKNGTDRDIHALSLLYDDDDGGGSSPIAPAHPPVLPLGSTELRLGTLTALNTTRMSMLLLPLCTGLVDAQHFWLAYEQDGVAYRRPYVFPLLIETPWQYT